MYFSMFDYLSTTTFVVFLNIVHMSFSLNFFWQQNFKKSITQDQWSQLLEFSQQVDSKFSNFDADGVLFIV